MSSSDPNLKGWDFLYKIIEPDVQNKQDILVALMHLLLLNCDYRCIGLGDSKVLTGEEKASEVLPNRWNADPNSYGLRYTKNEKLFIFKALVADDDIVVNLLNVPDVSVSSVAFNITNTVKAIKGESLKEMIPEFSEVCKKVQCELAMFGPLKEATTQTCQEQERRGRTPPSQSDPLRYNPPRHPDIVGVPDVQPRFDPFDYGRSDLDPFGRGGGMIFNPARPHQPDIQPGLGIPGVLPRGAVPPGARFDPMGPPDTDRRPQRRFPPDSDHMPPPGYEDMFM